MKLNIEFLSDWHIGSGAGIPGSTDSTVLRDENGLPYVPGKTLTGMLRDSAEFIASNLDAMQKPAGRTWTEVLKSLLGAQPESHGGHGDIAASPAKVAVGPARFSPAVAEVLAGHPGQRATLTFVQPGVKIDPVTGRAEDDHLFFIEKARGGISMAAEVEPVEGRPGMDEAEQALLYAAALNIRRIGGLRRRGAGDCRVTPDGFDVADDWKRVLASPPEPEEVSAPSSGQFAAANDVTANVIRSGGGFTTYRIQVTTVQPVIVATALKGNVLESMKRIPGTLLMPIVAGKLRELGVADIFGALSKADVIVTDCLPGPEGASRAYPAPMCFEFCKESPDERRNALADGERPEKQYKPIRDGWLGSSSVRTTGTTTTAWSYRHAGDILAQRMHNTVEDESQRPTEKVGGVYTYEAIRAGTVLVGGLLVRKSIGCSGLDGLKIKTSIGRSRKDDYGEVEIVIKKDDTETDAPSVNGKKLVIWLQSPMLVRNAALQYSANPRDLAVVLKDALGLGAAPELVQAFGRAERIESWHGPSNMPRSSLVSLAPGSVYVFETDGESTFDNEVLKKIQAEGLGERRAEGFGRILINHQLLLNAYSADRWVESVQSPNRPDALAVVSETEKKLLRSLDVAFWQETIVRAAREHAFSRNPCIRSDHGKPSRSQLGAMRAAAGAATQGKTFGDDRFVGEEDLDQIRLMAGIHPMQRGNDAVDAELQQKRRAVVLVQWQQQNFDRLEELLTAPSTDAQRRQGTVWRHLWGNDWNSRLTVCTAEAWRGLWDNRIRDQYDLMRPFAVKILLEQIAEAAFDRR